SGGMDGGTTSPDTGSDASPGPGDASPGPGDASPGPGDASPGPGDASPGPSDAYFRMNYTQAAAPTGGWSLGFIDTQNMLGVQYFSTLVVGVGPAGQNVYRTRITGGANPEFPIGFHGHPFNAAQRGPGTEVFTRFRFKAIGNLMANNYGQKIIMVFPEN